MVKLGALEEMTIDVDQLREFDRPSKRLLYILLEQGCHVRVNVTPDIREGETTIDLKKDEKNSFLEEIGRF